MRGHGNHSGFISIGRLHLIALVLLLVAQEAPAESLGRLFLTPEQRAVLELQRQYGTLTQQQEMADDSLRLDGVVRRNGEAGNGASTIWINGHPRHDERIDSRTGFTVFASQPERVDFHIGNESPATLRVGETFKHTAPRAAALPR